MGFNKQFISVAKKYKKDPRSEYFKNLQKFLDIHFVIGKVSKKEVLKYVTKWVNK